MLFCTQQFLVFFALIFTAYWALPWARARVWLLLAASFYFYACWNHWLAALICVSTVMDFFLARAIGASVQHTRRRLLLCVSVGANLTLLFYFKYANFFLDSLEEALRSAGVSASLPMLQVILPVGISFYTFEAISYIVDVYRRRIPAEKSLPNFMLFILFFPHLVAGPIVRARDFLPQARRIKRWNWNRMHLGAQYFLMGLFKKLAVADQMALFADPIFASPDAYRTTSIWMGVLAYTIQVYCDFSGYSDMALGAAHLLGYKLTQNFDMPYLAPNIADLWRRWHMSLSSWLRDYIFYPLGGSRGSGWQTCRNLLITMALCGLWHGASWHFVLFGLIQAVLLIVHRSFRQWCESRPTLDGWLQTSPGTILRVLTTFSVFAFSLVMFRTESLSGALNMWRQMFWLHDGLPTPLSQLSLTCLAAVVLMCHLLAQRGVWSWMVQRLPAPALGVGYGVVLSLTLLLAPQTENTFIYFQF